MLHVAEQQKRLTMQLDQHHGYVWKSMVAKKEESNGYLDHLEIYKPTDCTALLPE